MAQINEWLSIDKANGSGDATITLTASSSTELTERMASLEIRGITKSVYMNVRQRAYVAPSTNNDYFWVKLEESGDIQGLRTTFEYSYDLTNWNSCPTTLSVPADTYVWFRNTSSILNAENTSAILFTQDGSVGGDLSSMGDMRENNFRELFAENVGLVDASELILPWDRVVNRCFYDMFGDCVNLISPPELPATELEGACYIGMFSGCESLNIAPVLPATTLSFDPNGDTYGCYQSMFSGCISLMTAPTLPATILVNKCYMNMFFGCTSLMTAPSLPATSLANSCYQDMFFGCTLLPKTPSLPATTIPKNAYLEMFRGCTRLTTISHIGATDLSEADGMFRGCTSLTEFEVSEWVTDMSSNDMFNGCTNLKTIIVHPSTAPTITDYTFRGIAENGTLVNSTGSDYSSWLSTNTYRLGYYGWTAEPDPEQPNNDYFWVEFLDDSLTGGGRIKLVNEVNSTLEYSTDTITWTPLTYKTMGTYFNGGQRVYIRNTSRILNGGDNMLDYNKHYILNFTADCNIGGNLSSLGDMTERNFQRLFSVDGGSTHLKDASQLILPWDELSVGCFIEMFGVNRGLTAPPQLPATTLAKSCYSGMFYFCENMQVAPVLPATTLTDGCYGLMFGYCARLRDVKCYATNIDAQDALSNWLLAVDYTGNFTKVEGVTYPIGDSGIPKGWTIQEIP